MDCVCDNFKDPPKYFVSLCQFKVIQGHEVKKSNSKFWVWVVWYIFLGKIWRKTQKMILDHFLRAKSDKI